MHPSPYLPPEVFVPRLPAVQPAAVVAQGRVLDAVAGGDVLCGSSDEIARRLDLGAADLSEAIRELMAIGWLAREIGPDGRSSVRWADNAAEPVDGRRLSVLSRQF